MTRLRASRYGGQAPGFSLLELLIAAAITALLAAMVAAVVPSLQVMFEQTPAALDLQQRGRSAVDAITLAVRSADRVEFLDPDPSHPHFRRLMTVTRKANAARGVLEHDQSNAGGDLSLAAARCPAAADVCGFVRGATAAIADVSGRFDVFVVGSIDTRRRSISPRRRFDQPYAAGAEVIEVDAHTFRLAPQPDGSSTLVFDTGAGAVQPIADRVSDLRFDKALDGRGVSVAFTLQRQGMPPVESARRIAVMARNLP
jgi:prepilin-type N-terminal cleavage/methylation domain-containing protein